MMKLALMRIATGKEDPELPLVQRISSFELTAPQIAVQINASPSSSNRRISTSTVQRGLRESGLHGQIAAKKPLLEDTIARVSWPKQWTLIRPVEICPLVCRPNFRFLVPTAVSL